MKIFLSSVIRGFEEFREAAVEAIATLEHRIPRADGFRVPVARRFQLGIPA